MNIEQNTYNYLDSHRGQIVTSNQIRDYYGWAHGRNEIRIACRFYGCIELPRQRNRCIGFAVPK
jgi:hypothetical protein